jgi:hypothetical protein
MSMDEIYYIHKDVPFGEYAIFPFASLEEAKAYVYSQNEGRRLSEIEHRKEGCLCVIDCEWEVDYGFRTSLSLFKKHASFYIYKYDGEVIEIGSEE